MWTMEQLVERVSAALAAEYPGAPNGRVREVPDRRSIRWYTTIGLVDRPLGTRGRTVLYGPRHLLQLVAIKRRQAAGRTLAEIQAELAGASEETLAAVARVPDRVLGADGTTQPSQQARSAFWKASPTFDITADVSPPLSPAGSSPRSPGGSSEGSSGDSSPFSPAASTPLSPGDSSQRSSGDSPQVAPSDSSQVAPSDSSQLASGDDAPERPTGVVRRELAAAVDALVPPGRPVPPLITGVPLGGGVILLLPHHTTDLDRDDIVAAARPLLDLLASRGLTDGRNA
jgi:DNA-binding transcriptional MerR regulator